MGYPTRFPSVRCGDNHVGLVIYKEPVDQSSKYDAYCYRLKGTAAAQPLCSDSLYHWRVLFLSSRCCLNVLLFNLLKHHRAPCVFTLTLRTQKRCLQFKAETKNYFHYHSVIFNQCLIILFLKVSKKVLRALDDTQNSKCSVYYNNWLFINNIVIYL